MNQAWRDAAVKRQQATRLYGLAQDADEAYTQAIQACEPKATRWTQSQTCQDSPVSQGRVSGQAGSR